MSIDLIFIPPRNLELGEYKYSYKDRLTADYYTYRCTHRTKCKVVIKIKKSELIKYKEEQNLDLNYEITSKEKNHTCNNAIIKEKKTNKTENNSIATALILSNINKPISFHLENFKNNNLYKTKNQVERLLQKIRENNFPLDVDFLKDISKITITLDNEPELTNINICYKYVHILNPNKKNFLEKYIIFTTTFQMKMLKKSKQIFIDGTFKSCPRGYYQILNITSFIDEINGNIPIFMIPISGKSEFIYNKVFFDIKEILSENNISLNDIAKNIMCDFEPSLIKSVKKNFTNSKVDGCYFHFVKLMWSKAKSLGLCNRNNIKLTKILVFILKLLPFLPHDERENLFKKTEEYFSINSENEKKLLLYFKKNWLKNKYIDYYELSNDEYLSRTNNYVESFHAYLNSILESYHPKISYLIEKYSEYLRNVYLKFKTSLVKNSVLKKEKFSIINDILSFIRNFKKNIKIILI